MSLPDSSLPAGRYLALPGVEACFNRFRQAYGARNYGMAFEAFMEALEVQPGVAYRFFATQASMQLIYTIRCCGRLEQVVSRLEHHFDRYPHMHLMYYGPDHLCDYFIARREDLAARHVPSVALITQAKSASISIASIFTSGLALPSFAYSLVNHAIVPAWLRDYARGGACYVTHLWAHPQAMRQLKQSGIDKIAVHVRDPRQALVSLMHHVDMYPDQLVEIRNGEFIDAPVEQKLRLLMTHYVTSVEWIAGWVRASKELPVHFTTFEDFTRDKQAFIQSYVDWYDVPAAEFSYENATARHVGTDYHFRKGEVSEWRQVIPEAMQKRLSLILPDDIKEKFAWPA